MNGRPGAENRKKRKDHPVKEVLTGPTASLTPFLFDYGLFWERRGWWNLWVIYLNDKNFKEGILTR